MAPRILIFPIAMGADYTFELNAVETYAPQYFGRNNLFLGSVLDYYIILFQILPFTWCMYKLINLQEISPIVSSTWDV